MSDGVLLLLKPPGCSSHDVAQWVRRRLKAPCGHLGTLDPLAAGLLVVAAGRATRLIRYAEGQEKEYVAEIWLGLGTASEDFAGDVTAKADASHLGRSEVEAALTHLAGETMQLPPAFSARQVAGERAYRAARRGRALDLPMRPARLLRWEIVDLRPGEILKLRLQMRVSSGYYVRSLARDLGLRLGVPGVLASLVRSLSGPFRIEQARTLEEELDLLPMDVLIGHLPRVEFGLEEARRLLYGQRLPGAGERQGPCAAYAQGRLLGVLQARSGVFHPETVLGMEE